MVKYCKVRFMTHCMAGEIGGVNETSVEAEMRKTETITTLIPPQGARSARSRPTLKTMAAVGYSISTTTLPSEAPCLHSRCT